MMYREIAVFVAMVILGWLIVIKSDQQFVRLLEGKLFKQNRKVEIANIVYRKNLTPQGALLFTCGNSSNAAAVVLFARDDAYFLFPAILGVLLCGLGVWGRVSSFRAADRELDEIGEGKVQNQS